MANNKKPRPMFRDRIKDLRRVPAKSLIRHPQNWRKHGQEQRNAMRAILGEVGYADALIAIEVSDGRLMLIDGHLRAEVTPDQKVPVLVTDLSEQEAKKLLSTLDAIGAAAEIDEGALGSLLAEIEFDSAEVDELLAGLFGLTQNAKQEPTELREVPVEQPPTMAWVLLGIALDRFGEINESIEKLAAIDGVWLEIAASDKRPD